jgi:hypothetical protein
MCSLICGRPRSPSANIEGSIKKQDREKFMYILVGMLFTEQAHPEPSNLHFSNSKIEGCWSAATSKWRSCNA